jgi:hypothetical protein
MRVIVDQELRKAARCWSLGREVAKNKVLFNVLLSVLFLIQGRACTTVDVIIDMLRHYHIIFKYSVRLI